VAFRAKKDFFGESSRVTAENSSLAVEKIRREPRAAVQIYPYGGKQGLAYMLFGIHPLFLIRIIQPGDFSLPLGLLVAAHTP
jgi:hypothetical protein